MQLLSDIAALPFEIPAWQLGVYLILVSFFVVTRRTMPCLGLTYFVTLYWLYRLFQPFFFVGEGGGSFLAVAGYILLALVFTGGLAYAYFGDRGPQVTGFSRVEFLNVRRTLLKRVDKLESALLKATESKLDGEMRRFEELRQQLEARVSKLPLETSEVGWGDGTLRDEREEELALKLRELESQLLEKEELLRSVRGTPDRESDSGAETVPIEEELQEKDKALENLQHELQDWEEKLSARIQELEAEIGRLTGQLRDEEEKKIRSESRASSQLRDSVLESTVPPWKATLDLREEKEAVMEARLQRLWKELTEAGVLIQEREWEVQIIQQWVQ